ncbi:MAG: HesA/MoeB/ThiF family protein [Pseudomonadota bacterium]
MPLSPEDLERHKRHIMLKEIGGPGVARLKTASVSIIGAGALGGPCALYLAAAGVGQIEIWDHDTVDRSNLQRQVQFTEADIGNSKSVLLADRLRAQNPTLKITAVQKRFNETSTLSGDILIDASDNFPTRFALNQLAHSTARYLVSGAASRWAGQVSVFASGLDPAMPCYRCFVSEEPPEAEACDEVGVVGALTGSIGAAMALEAIKLITGAGTPLIGRLQIHDALESSVRTVKLRPDPECPVCSTGSAR